MCFAYAYADYKGVSVNLFTTRAERDAAVLDLLDDLNGDGNAFPPTATAEEAWAVVCREGGADFHLGFNEL